MGKQNKPYVKRAKDQNGNQISKKAMSHGSYRCQRKPNSKWCNA